MLIKKFKFYLLRISCLLLTVCVLTSCAHHSKIAPVIKIPDFYDYKIREGDLDVVVDTYEKPYKMEYMFSSDLTEKGILAIHLIIWNRGTSEYNLENAKIIIRTAEGKEFTPLQPDQVSEKVLPSTIHQMLGFGALGTALIFFTVPFAVGAGIESELAKKSIKKDYQEKQIKKDIIAPGTLFHGFLFFSIADNEAQIKQAFNRGYYFYLTGLKNDTTGEEKNIQIRFELESE